MGPGAEIVERQSTKQLVRALARLLDSEGPPLLEDPEQAGARLGELLPGLTREIRLVRLALELGLHRELLARRGAAVKLASLLVGLASRMEQACCLKPWAASWVTRVLAASLGLAVPPPGALSPSVGSLTSPRDEDTDVLAGQFEAMDSVPPSLAFRLEHDPVRLHTRTIDLFCPVGRGQRCLVIGQHGAGKTSLLREVATGLAARPEDLWLAGLQVGFHSEEGQALQEILGNGVFALPDDPASAVEVAECLLDDARRLALQGYDAVLLVDSMTHLARAYATLDGTDGAAGPRRLLETGRNLRQGGSITVIGTVLHGGDQADHTCLARLTEASNCQIWLQPNAARPTIQLARSETREEARLLSPPVLRASRHLRQQLQALPPALATKELHRRLARYPTNRGMLQALWDGEQ